MIITYTHFNSMQEDNIQILGIDQVFLSGKVKEIMKYMDVIFPDLKTGNGGITYYIKTPDNMVKVTSLYYSQDSYLKVNKYNVDLEKAEVEYNFDILLTIKFVENGN